MNTLKTTMSKIAQIEQPKVELAKHEIKLGTLDEYNRSVFGDETWVKELNDFVTKSADLIKQLEMRVDGGMFVGQEAKKAISKTIAMEAPLKKAIKDLGVEEPSEFKKNQDKIRKIQSEVNALIKKLESYNK